MKQAFQKRCANFAKINYRKVPDSKIIPAQFSFENARCHTNAVAAVRAGRADKAWMVLAGNGDDDVCVHFINSKDGKFFDETWHEYDAKWTYYIIRQVEDNEFSLISDLLGGAKQMFFDTLASPIERLFFRNSASRWI